MKNILKNIINIISSVLFFGVFFVINAITVSSESIKDMLSLKNIIILLLSIIVYSLYVIYSGKLQSYIDLKFSLSGKESLNDKLLSKFVDDVMNYCISLGMNPSLRPDEDNNLIIADVNKDNKKIIDFSIPTEKELNEKNYNLYFEHIKDLIDKANGSEE